MYILRQFKLVSGRLDYQYVSSLNSKGHPIGYDKQKQYKIALSDWQLTRAKAYLDSIGAVYQVVEA